MIAVQVVSLLAILLAAGCGHIANYTDPSLKSGKTGILYYPPKPYLLVSRTGAKDKPVEVQVVYLPDLANPRYAVMRSGYGSSKLTLAFSNGVLVSAGQETDPKITEAITALANIPGALANAAKTRAETAAIRKEGSDLPKAAKAFRTVAQDIRNVQADPRAKRALLPSQADVLKRLPQELDDVATVLERPDTADAGLAPIIASVEGVKKKLSSIKPGSDNVSDADASFWASIRSIEAALDTAITELKPKPEAAPTVSLYEVIMDSNGTQLREVPLSTMTGHDGR